MKVGYGYRRDEADLRSAGAERVYIDMGRDRADRADMIAHGLRSGDTLVLLYLRDLGGSPVADRVWRERVEALGVTVEIARPTEPPKKIGRPRKFDPTSAQEAQVRAIWLDGTESERVRLRRVAAEMGHEVSRGILHGRYGGPSKPRPVGKPTAI